MDGMDYQYDLLHAMNEKLLDNDKMYRMICGTSSNAFLYYEYNENRYETLGCWDSYFDFPVEKSNDFQRVISCVKPAYMQDLEAALYCERSRKESQTVECELDNKNKWVEFEVTVTYDRSFNPSEKIVRIRDITKSKHQTEDLKYMAYYDALTGLYNRNYFVRILSEWVRKAEDESAIIDVVCMKIDDYKKISDSKGLLIGDELLQNFGLLLREMQGEDVVFAHFYEDVYYMAVYNAFGKNSVEAIYKNITGCLKKQFILTNNTEETITISAGVARYPEAAVNSLELINCAEIVLDHRKEPGKSSMQYFEAPILSDFLQTIDLENQLKDAISRNAFEMYYQPQFDSATKKLRGVEALIRWRNHDGKFVSPALFIPIAEKDGLIVQIGNFVVEQAIRDFSVWFHKYNFNMTMSINISAIQYKKADFVSNLLHLLEKYQVDPKYIELEITETMFIDDMDLVIKKLHDLREYGIKISLDDFGTGYSSLSYLKKLPIDTLKIDKSFIDTVIHDNSTRVITESIVGMVKKLGCETVAEGVESAEQLEYLRQIECDNIQGFLLGKPMPAGKLEELISGY